MKPLPKSYDHLETEKRWQSHWLEQQTYAWDESAPREETFVIDTPPPTVSGLLHMGHIFSYTQADFVARYQRMAGKTVFYPMGFDDNGLPTERLVEKVKKIRATDMSREEFTALCEGVAEEARGEFRELFRSVALSVDWKQEYHTIGADERKLSQMSFLDLYNKGHAYRELKPFFWDPVDQTAIAQAEIEDKELPSTFNDIYFEVRDKNGNPLNEKEFGGRVLGEGKEGDAIIWRDGKSYIVIGSTRPELLPACVGVFYNAEDTRYAGLEGMEAVTPLFGVRVPILTDETVEIDKGTGIMMCCTFGDEKDIDKWRKHKLDARIILNKYGKLDFGSLRADAIMTAHDNMNVMENKKVSNPDPKNPGAREIIIGLLQEAGLLVASRPIVHAVKCAERSGAPLEILPTQQWFVRLMDKKDALKAKAAECDWKPPYMKLRIDQWIDGLNSDWCISRQRYFGVPFPVWYCTGVESKKTYTIAARSKDLPVNPLTNLPSGIVPVSAGIKLANSEDFPEISKEISYSKMCHVVEDVYDIDGNLAFNAGSENVDVVPEKDVMDTWATSSISPQLSSRSINDDYALDALPGNVLSPAQRHAKLFPADMRPQAHEIIRTWAFYSIVKAYLHEDTIPWKHLMISGWCLAADKTKMSKSKGNVVTPVALIEEKGSDAVRYWASTSRLGADTAFSEDLLKIGRKLVTKLWNATQFASLNLVKLTEAPTTAREDMANARISETLDRWILTRLARAVTKATEAFETFEYADARVAIEDFFWNDFCDNYLELVKTRAYGEASDQPPRSALITLHHCLNTLLKLFAPFVPHITEELFSHIFDAEYAATGSVHSRSSWPKTSDYSVDDVAEKSGIAAVMILNAIRKAKSERNVSIKFPITELVIATGPIATMPVKDLMTVLEDLKAAGSVQNVTSAAAMLDAETATADNGWLLKMVFSEAAATV